MSPDIQNIVRSSEHLSAETDPIYASETSNQIKQNTPNFPLHPLRRNSSVPEDQRDQARDIILPDQAIHQTPLNSTTLNTVTLNSVT